MPESIRICFLPIQCFSNPFDMLEEMSRSGAPDIALLDICMPGVLGTEAPAEIQSKSGGTTDIIFRHQPGFCGGGICFACK